MEVFEYQPESQVGFKFPWAPLKIMPIGDIQAGSSACDLGLLKHHVQWAISEDCYFIGMGDYVDPISPSNRKAWGSIKGSLYDSFVDSVDEKMKEHEDAVFKILEPTRGRWLGMLTGHHYYEYEDGSSTDINLCRRLETKHLGQCSMIRLSFQDEQRNSLSCIIWAHHGQGGGLTVGAPLNKLERVAMWAEADLYLMGHQHKRVSAPIPRLYLTNSPSPTLIAREKRLVCTGSYLKGYMQGHTKGGVAAGTYVEEKMLAPVSLGSPMITITPSRKTRDGQNLREIQLSVTT